MSGSQGGMGRGGMNGGMGGYGQQRQPSMGMNPGMGNRWAAFGQQPQSSGGWQNAGPVPPPMGSYGASVRGGGQSFARTPMTADMFGPDGRMNRGGGGFGTKPAVDQFGGMGLRGTMQDGRGGYMRAGGDTQFNRFNDADQWQPSFGGNQPQPFFGNAGAQPNPNQGGGWQPSFGGNQPVPFMGQSSPPPAQPPAPTQSQPPAPTGNPVVDQRAMDAYNNERFTAAGKLGNAPGAPTLPPWQRQQPTEPMQPGQGGWHIGPPPTGSRDSQFAWQPSYFPGQNEYIGRMIGSGTGAGNAPWFNQINWNDAVNSIGQLSGTPFNPNDWSR